MNQLLVGRKNEMKMLKEYFHSERSEFIAVYGRRRVGKTYLIRKAAEDNFSFFVTGVHGASKSEQLINFAIALQKYSHSASLSIPKNWILAFYELSRYLETLPEGVKLIFIDELPWMDTAKSGFIPALENFWNSWAVLRNDVKLIVCGSATSWMINNLIRSRGGLHNRLTHHLILEPFSLAECEEYFRTFGFPYTRKQMIECYMVMGGIPFYMSMLDKSMSLVQNIDRLFFAKNAPLKDEFDDLYRALFKNALPHIEVVTALATKGKGLTRQEILSQTKLADNGMFSVVLEELEHCGFIRQYEPLNSLGGKRLNSNTLFQLIDFYTLFYFNFIKSNRFHDEHFWMISLNTPLYHAWSGFAFERVCLAHLGQIKRKLGISGVQTRACSWRSAQSGQGAQIDMLIDRKDETINVCEMKYTHGPFEITKEYEEKLVNKLNVLAKETGLRKSLMLTLITTYGVKPNLHSGIVQSEVVMDDLFEY